ncbi:MAG: hypothetical protein L0Y67_01330 [Gammaproteobacteria bacterium]|nr:hypothetical protein [Gammaproteobacteria bacterium]MCI0590246.1 hypothetical protein [Gammaproteobacteria bacterium]
MPRVRFRKSNEEEDAGPSKGDGNPKEAQEVTRKGPPYKGHLRGGAATDRTTHVMATRFPFARSTQLCYLSSSNNGIGLPWRVIFNHGVQYH